MTIDKLRTTLAARQDAWTAIAEAAGCSRKTIERIVRVPNYLPTVRTALAIERALGGFKRNRRHTTFSSMPNR